MSKDNVQFMADLTYGKARKQFSIGVNLKPVDWDQKKPGVKSSCKQESAYNGQMTLMKGKR
ncbi:hypothetical protein [Aegicerativicinus sediminis]|uniref:hypothetical protein n=1 Tax=Aegicerativicinus sediminis TaxID=2893202 RepID=UPI0037430940